MVEMPERKFKSLIFKMINDFKEHSYNQINKVKKSIQNLNETLDFSDLGQEIQHHDRYSEKEKH
jgi:hypothetical protein